MNNLQHHLTISFSKKAIFILLSALLSACGGSGGGGSDSRTVTTASSNSLQITSDNAVPLAKAGSTGASAVSKSAATTATSLGNAVVVPVDGMATRLVARVVATSTSSQYDQPLNCSVSGLVQPDLTISSDGSSGDVSVSGFISFKSCNNDAEYVIDGGLTVSGSFDSNTNEEKLDLSGVMSLTEIATSKVGQLSNFSLAITASPSGAQWTNSFHGSGSMFDNQSFTLSTLEPIVSQGSDTAEPTDGIYLINGANQSFMTMRMAGSSGAYLALNGGTEQLVSWDDINSASFSTSSDITTSSNKVTILSDAAINTSRSDYYVVTINGRTYRIKLN